MRVLALKKDVLKDITDLPAKQYRQVVGAIFELLVEPFPHYSKKLRGSPYWRIAIGEYRVIYRADDMRVSIIAFGKRNDDAVYRELARKQ
jgi:mRNA interferase RelE/StbE